jgi:UDP-N-acetylmuramate dehydrogenase
MDKHTTFRIGGRAGIFLVPDTGAELAAAVAEYPGAFILGGGSNLLVSDEGVDAVISMSGLKEMEVRTEADGATHIVVGAGYAFTSLSRVAYRKGLAGLEFAFGIPGTVGGAVVMNAGAGGGEVKDCLESARIFSRGDFHDVSAAELGLSYRSSALPAGAVVVSATFALMPGDRREIRWKMERGIDARKQSQPLAYPSAGSVFKNPPGDFAGRLIDSLGLKGLRVGDAEISSRHANFIVNMGKATARQVLALIEKVEETVLDKTGIRLEREIRLVGSFHP